MWTIITTVFVFMYHSVCEYLLFLVIDLIFKGPLDRALSEKDLGVLWALEGSVLLVCCLLVNLLSHRPYVLWLLTLFTFLYSLLKYDDSLKEVLHLTVRFLRWADSRFFLLRCLARRQWRRWRLAGGSHAGASPEPGRPAPSTPLQRPGLGLAGRLARLRGCSVPEPLSQMQRTPRMGPAQLFSASGMALTEPPARRWAGPVTRFRGDTVGRLRVEEEEGNEREWKREVADTISAIGRALSVVLGRLSASLAAAMGGAGAQLCASSRPPRGLRRSSACPLVAANSLLQVLAHCPFFHATLNRLRPSAGCSVGQEAMFAALLPVVNALASAGAEVEAAERTEGRQGFDWARTVDPSEVREALHKIDGQHRALSDLAEWLLMEVHLTCKDIDKSPRLRRSSDRMRNLRGAICDEVVCLDRLDIAHRELQRLSPPTSLSTALAVKSVHREQTEKLADLTFLANKWRLGHSELRQLVEGQCLDIGLCALCGHLGVSAATFTVLRLPNPHSRAGIGQPPAPLLASNHEAISLTEYVRRALCDTLNLCSSVQCPCGGARAMSANAGLSPPQPATGFLSPIVSASTPSRPAPTPGSLPPAAAQTSTPVTARRCRGGGGCCRRVLRHLPPCLLVHLAAAENGGPGPFALLPPAGWKDLELGLGCVLPGEAPTGYVLRAAVTAAGLCYVRVGAEPRLWFLCEDELVRQVEAMETEWFTSRLGGCERLLVFERRN